MIRHCEHCAAELKRRPLENYRDFEVRRFCNLACKVAQAHKPAPKRTAGSGVIAGRIEIGRGARWGAGIV